MRATASRSGASQIETLVEALDELLVELDQVESIVSAQSPHDVRGHGACARPDFQNPLPARLVRAACLGGSRDADISRQGPAQESAAGHDRARRVKLLAELSPEHAMILQNPGHPSVLTQRTAQLKPIAHFTLSPRCTTICFARYEDCQARGHSDRMRDCPGAFCAHVARKLRVLTRWLQPLWRPATNPVVRRVSRWILSHRCSNHSKKACLPRSKPCAAKGS